MDTLGCPQTKSARVFPMREGEFYQPCARAEGFSWEFHYEPRYEEWESSAEEYGKVSQCSCWAWPGDSELLTGYAFNNPFT